MGYMLYSQAVHTRLRSCINCPRSTRWIYIGRGGRGMRWRRWGKGWAGTDREGKRERETKRHWQGERSESPPISPFFHYSWVTRSGGGEGGEEIAAFRLSLECAVLWDHPPPLSLPPICHSVIFAPGVSLYPSFLSSLADLNFWVLRTYPGGRAAPGGWKTKGSEKKTWWSESLQENRAYRDS